MVEALLIPFLKRSGWAGTLQPKNMRGSGHFLSKIARAVERSLQPEEKVDYVFGLLDLHGVGLSYPREVTSRDQKAEYLKKHLRELVSFSYRGRFHPHVAVHELEAWVLADDGALRDYLKQPMQPWPTPEAVNFDSPPVRHLKDLFMRHKRVAYGKAVHGKRLFEMIDPRIVMNKCHHFKLFVDDLMMVSS